ncbi:MAG TPA: hypothetical protein PLU25_13840, partial [Acidobacteriota bacterium]|nr:hypothetical protein [Acidobacteriota bacterium]
MNRRRYSCELILLLALALATVVVAATGPPKQKAVQADTYAIDWWTVAGGGGASSGGPYLVEGTIGQPVVGISAGNEYSLASGFWLPLEQTLYAAHVASTETWWTRLTLLNAGDADNPITLTAYSAAGAQVEQVGIASLPPGNVWQADVDTVFAPATLAQDLWVTITSGSSLTGVLEFGTRDGQSVVVMPMLAASAADLVYPYVALTYGWYTGLAFINTGDADAHVTVTAYNENGNSLATHTETLAPRSKYVRLIDQAFPEVADPGQLRMVKAVSDQPLIGFELFGHFESPGLAGLPAFTAAGPLTGGPAAAPAKGGDAPLAVELHYNEIMPNDGYFTGVTFCNLGVAPATVSAELFDCAGVSLAVADWPVNPLQQITREVWNIFDGTVHADAGYMQANAPVNLLGFELFFNRTGLAAQFRFDGILAETAGRTRMVFPMIRCESGWMTHVRLTNRATINNSYRITGYSA